VLDHAEAIQSEVVKFFFKRAPSVGAWQYGALQGPVVQGSYWSTKVAGAAALLPSPDLAPQVEALKRKVTDLQEKVNGLVASGLTATTGDQARRLQADLRRQQGNLNEANNDLAHAQDAIDQGLAAAQKALFALDDSGEPHLGKWQPIEATATSGAGASFVNEANPNFPGPPASFDRAVYRTYATSAAALADMQTGALDVILDPSMPVEARVEPEAVASPSRSVRFLAFQPGSRVLQAAIRQAIACMIDQQALVGELDGRAAPLSSFVPWDEGVWSDPDMTLPCHKMNEAARLASAAEILKGAGYTWQQDPGPQTAGEGLTAPDGKLLPAAQLWTPQGDDLRASAAAYVERQARRLGIPVTAQSVSRETIDYGIFNTQRYDMAIVGWRVSAYPGYLCDWFGDGMPFHHDHKRLTATCNDLRSTSELDTARAQIREIESILAEDVPMLPLYSDLTYDAYRNVVYPFTRILGGLSSVYGAPGLAIPSAP
jgi:hypothetical protein